MSLSRDPQLRGSFTPGDPLSGYYNDLRGVADGYGSPGEADGWIILLARKREHVWPVSMLQLGLGAWQHVQAGAVEWQPTVRQLAEWAVLDMDGYGRLAHHQPMPHTFELTPPWFSAMAQGQAASLLVRAAAMFDQPELLAEARNAVEPLLDQRSPLVVRTDEGPVLQEYPTQPPAHVLNGWIWALWGLYDVSHSLGDYQAAAAFEAGVDTLVRRLPLYEVGRSWSRYDLYPHPVRNVASPFYHRLHVEQLRALNDLAPRQQLTDVADRWERALASRTARVDAVARKVGFRLLKPRRQVA